MQAQWRWLEAWLKRELPELLADLNQGCDPAEWAAFEDALGIPLPAAVRDFYLIHDGQQGEITNGLFFGLDFLSTHRILEEWSQWSVLLDDIDADTLAELNQSCTSVVPGKVKELYINPQWIPFCYDWGGNHLGLDLDPGPSGVVGQIINFGNEENDKYVLADSFEQFIDWMIAQLQADNYLFLEEEDGSKSFNIKAPPSSHFLDAARQIFVL